MFSPRHQPQHWALERRRTEVVPREALGVHCAVSCVVEEASGGWRTDADKSFLLPDCREV